MYNMSEACSDINVVRQQLVSVGESRGCILMVRGPRHGSLSGALYGCARLPIHISGGSTDGNQPLLLLSSLSHAFVQLHALLPLNLLCVTYQTAVLEFYLESLLVQSYNAPNRLLFKTTLKPLQGTCTSYLNCPLASS